jgi:probable F420-dependent oxidoreductase
MQSMQLGKLGVWASTEGLTADESAQFAQRVEEWGYSVLWIPEGYGRNPLVHAAWLLANTKRLIVATGIANIYARDALAMVGAQMALAEQSGGRFLLGLGVSHARVVEGVRGHRYERPASFMREYLQAMSKITYGPPAPPEKPPVVIAALGPIMLKLAADLTAGAHPYNVTPQHTAEARQILGAGKWLCPEQMVVVETDPIRARKIARGTLATYLGLPNYTNNLRRFGFTDIDFADGGSDRLMDALVAWGDAAALKKRVQEHWDAGADHVCIQALSTASGLDAKPNIETLQALAPGRR